MSEVWESRGQYLNRPYTKLDVWAINEEKEILGILKQERLRIAAIHEYVHAFLTKASNYGMYIVTLNNVLKSRETFKDGLTGSSKQRLNDNQNKIYKFFLKMNENMKEMQETLATLIEILYICHIKNYKTAKDYMDSAISHYKNYIKDFSFIIEEGFLCEIKDIYVKYLEIKDPHLLEEYKGNNGDDNIFLSIMCLLEIGTVALNINLLGIGKEVLIHPNSYINKLLSKEDCNPGKRFKKIMYSVFGEHTISKDLNMLFKYNNAAKLEDFKKEILEALPDTDNENSKEIKETETEFINEMFVRPIDIKNAKDFEKEAVMTAIPWILCKGSASLFESYYDPNKPRYNDDNVGGLREFLKIVDRAYIKVPMGYEHDNECYYIIELECNKLPPKVEIRSDKFEKDKPFILFYKLRENDLFGCIKAGYFDNTTIILEGNYHLKLLIDKLIKHRNLKIYLMLSNCMSFTKNFIKLVTYGKKKLDACFIGNKEIENILVIRNDNLILFNPLINQDLEEKYNEEYNLVFSNKILSGKDKSIIKDYLLRDFGREAHDTVKKKDEFF